MAIENLAGQVIKGYELTELIASGGFGMVYRAKQAVIEREVAIKIILPELASQPEFIRRFDTEAQLVARLEHPHIVPLYDYWRNPDGAYLVMRYLRGGTLRSALNQGAFDPKTCAQILDQIAAALDLAHRNDVIHRDIKPGNILLDEDGNAYLGDFGIAKDIGAFGSEITDSNNMVGSLDYITPEQARGEDVTQQTDVYSLGILLYEMLVGEHPFAGILSVQRVYKHMSEPIPDITTLPEEIRDEVNLVLQKATEKDPSQRYQSALALAVAYREAIGMADTQPVPSVVNLLTNSERQIISYIAQGLDTDQMAQNLSLTLSTVRWQIQQVYNKLGVTNREEVIEQAKELEIVDPEGNLIVTDINDRSVILTLPEPVNPYKGLYAFQSTDARDFFGREDQVDQLVERMGEDGLFSRFLAIIGPSGSGKSSLVRAGLIPALRRGALPHSDSWFYTDMVPGITPVEQLLVALVHIASDDLAEVHHMLKSDKFGLMRAMDYVLPNDGSELLIFIDQFEEIFTLVEDEDTRTHFLSMLRFAVSDPNSRVRIIVTLRADYYDRPLQYNDFGNMLRSRMETILPLSASGLERAIVAPSERVGVSFEPGLVAHIVEEMHHQIGALPLLQYALTELFDRRQGWILTHDAYDSIGGSVGALANRADEIFQQLDDEGKHLTQQLFLRLVTLGEGAEDTRRRATIDEILSVTKDNQHMQDIIDMFAKYRLLSLDHDPDTRKPTVEVAHEAILREWEQLRNWLNASRDDIRQERTLEHWSHEWDEAERDKSYLLSGSRLEIYETWSNETTLALTPTERGYLNDSIRERESRLQVEADRQAREDALERRSRIVLSALVFVFALLAIISITLSVIAFDARDSAQENFTRAEQIRLSAQAQIALDNDEDVIIPALLSLKSLEIGYSPQADSTLLASLGRGFSERLYEGHQGEITSLDLSPDNRLMVTGSNDQTAIIWDVASGEIQHILEGHTDIITGAIFSADGTQIATASPDRTVRFWDVESGEEIRQLPIHMTSVSALAWSPDGQTILTSDESTNAILWTTETGLTRHILTGHLDIVNHGFFSPDSRLVVTGGFDNNAIIWDVETGENLQILRGHEGCVCGGAFSSDGNRIVTASYDQTARIWNVNSGNEIRRLVGHTSILYSAQFSSDDDFVLTASEDKTARIWDTGTGQELRQLVGHTAGVSSLDMSSDERTILTGSFDGTARLWDFEAQIEPRVFTPPFTTSRTTDILFIKQISSDGKIIATGSNNGLVRFWSVERGITLGRPVQTGVVGTVNDIAHSPNFIATAGNTISLWDEDSGELDFTLDAHDSEVLAVTFSSDNNRLLSGGDDGTVRLFDVRSHEALLVLASHITPVRAIAFSEDDSLIVTGSDNGELRLWETATGTEIRAFVGHNGIVRSVAISPDNSMIVSVGDDEIARLWDSETGIELDTLEGHTDAIYAVAFSPDGKTLITGSADLTARVWDVETGEVLRQLSGHNDIVRSVGFTQDGKFIMTGDNVSTYIWTANLQDVIDIACEQLPRDFTTEERELFSIGDTTTCNES